MAQGTLQFFDQYMEDLHDPSIGHDLSAGNATDVRVALIDSVFTPETTTADPRWGAGGGTNVFSNEVTTSPSYITGGKQLVNFQAALNAGAVEYTSNDITPWLQDAGGDTDCRWGIVYNNTLAGKQCIGWIDLGSSFDMSGGSLDINVVNPMATLNQV